MKGSNRDLVTLYYVVNAASGEGDRPGVYKIHLYDWFPMSVNKTWDCFRDILFSVAPCNLPSGVVYGEAVQHPSDN